MSAEDLLSRVEGVRETGRGRYICRCPSHDDRSPSLAVTETSDGRTLVHCFAGCETEDVLSAVGLTFSDVMPERIGPIHGYEPLRRWFDARQVLATLDHEAMVTAVIAADVLEHKEVDEETWSRLGVAVHRINEARATCPPARVGR